MAHELDKDDREYLEECSLKQLRNLEAAFSLVPFMGSTNKSYYFNAFIDYQGTDWHGNVTRLLGSGLSERVSDLCIILQWVAEGLDIFTTQTLVITASLDIDMKVEVMRVLSLKPAELENTDYVAELQATIEEASCIRDVRDVIERARIKFFDTAKKNFDDRKEFESASRA